MITDHQVRKLMKLNQTEKTLSIAAAKSGMCENSARKYLNIGKLPSQSKAPRTWRTRADAFESVWPTVKEMLEANPGLEGKTIFEWLQRESPGIFEDGQLRSFQRRIKQWRALKGPGKEVYFDQVHKPGELCESDFTDLSNIGITIQGVLFTHLLYHFVLTYSNWETGTICYSESFESLSTGLQNALWELGGIPQLHRTDRLTAAVQMLGNSESKFNERYHGLLRHYKLQGQKIQTGKPNENGDVEQRHHRFKRALEQSLLLRGSRDFNNLEEYTEYLRKLFKQLNSGRMKRFKEEQEVLNPLPHMRIGDYTEFTVKVGPSSTIRVKKNTYSVHSRLIGERVLVRLYADHLEIRYAQKKIEEIPRMFGESKHHIQYRHIIDWLVRKPGAFENYRYRSDLFPTSHFRMAYDAIKERSPTSGHKEYLKILRIAAKETEIGVDNALSWLLDTNQLITSETVAAVIISDSRLPEAEDIEVNRVDLRDYDTLLTGMEVI